MRTKVKTSFLNGGSTFQSGVEMLSDGTSRAVLGQRYWAWTTVVPRRKRPAHARNSFMRQAKFGAFSEADSTRLRTALLTLRPPGFRLARAPRFGLELGGLGGGWHKGRGRAGRGW